MSEYDTDTVKVNLVIDGEKAHYQTDPFFDSKKNKVIIKRLATIDVEIVNVGLIVSMAQQIKELEKK